MRRERRQRRQRLIGALLLVLALLGFGVLVYLAASEGSGASA